jgi:hypothetical protein
LETFRAQFREIVERHGWHGWTGEDSAKGEAWRTRVIFETNLRSSYAVGRYAQQTDPALLARCPYWQYVYSDSVRHPRREHLAWGDTRLTLRHDHPFWQTHYPPNGWGCACRAISVRQPADGAQTAPPVGWDQATPKTGEPPGIDRGWGYAPGATRAEELRNLAEGKAKNYPEPLRGDFLKAALPADDLPMPATVDEFIAAGKRIVDATGSSSPERVHGQIMDRLAKEAGVGRACAVVEKGAAASLLKDAARQYPASWVEAADRLGPLHARLKSSGRGYYWAAPANYPLGYSTRLTAYGSVYPARGEGFILISGSDHGKQFRCAVHEYGHRLQTALPALQEKFAELHRQRTQGNPLKKLRTLRPDDGYRADELTLEDHYIRPYWGKDYGGEPLEVLTMSMQTVIAGDDFYKLYNEDREMLDFIVGILFHWRP